jgi:hypothetical protein
MHVRFTHSSLQVQYAASEAVRTFLNVAQPFRDEVLPVLLPSMCFNRHIATEGLRAYSQVEGASTMAQSCSQPMLIPFNHRIQM